MYDELIKSLRVCASSGLPDSCLECPRFENGCDTLREDAADAIGILSKMEKTTQWIPVTERLPENAYGESNSVLTISSLGSMRILYFDGGDWCYPTGEALETACKYPITHWMPLPEPPNEGE